MKDHEADYGPNYKDDNLISDLTKDSLSIPGPPDDPLMLPPNHGKGGHLVPLPPSLEDDPVYKEIQAILLADQLQRNPLLDNILIRQKDSIIQRIDSLRSRSEAKHVIHTLSVVEELWSACNYTYKYQELRERLRTKLASFREKN